MSIVNNNQKKWLAGVSIFAGLAAVMFSIAAVVPEQNGFGYVSNKEIVTGNPSSLFFVTDGGDIHDGSFNEAGYNAVTAISGNKNNLEAPENANYSTLIHAYRLALAHGAQILEVNGFNHVEPLTQFSYNHSKNGVILLDAKLNVDGKEQGNVASITFESQQVGFLAGYAAAAWATLKHQKSGDKTNHPLISGVGGEQIPPITTYLAGFEQGMNQFNKDHSQDPPVMLWPTKATYFGGFSADPNNKVTAFTDQAITNHVDVIFPVGGPQTFTVVREIQNRDVSQNEFCGMRVIGVDQNLTNQSFAGLPQGGTWNNYVLGSATKGIKVSIDALCNAIYHGITSSSVHNKTGKYVFGETYTGVLGDNPKKPNNGWLILTGPKDKNGHTLNAEQLYKKLKIKEGKYKAVWEEAKKASSTSKHYYPK